MAETPPLVRDVVELAALAVAGICTALLALALAAEVVRRHDERSRLVRWSDRLLPSRTRRLAVAVVALLSTITAVAGPRAAAATPTPRHRAAEEQPGGLRSWLEDQASTTTVPTTATTQPTSPAPSPESTPTERRVPPPRPARGVPPVLPAAEAPTTVTPYQAPSPPPVTAPTAIHTVIAGDCLWSIAAQLLGPDAAEAAIDHGWRAIYAENRAAVGDDPSLIHPGLGLTIPALDPNP